MRRLLLGAGVLTALCCSGRSATANGSPWLDPPSSEVEQRAKVADEDGANRAVDRGQLALATGQMRRAVTEFREVVGYRQAQLKALQARRGQICDPRTLADAEGELAVARVLLAEAEQNYERLAKLLPEVIRYHRSRSEHIRSLARLGAIGLEEAVRALRQLKRAELAAGHRLEEMQQLLERRIDGKSKPGSPR